ncbi:MAG TPA: 8-amino-7-oxononanoate synthase [Verrucomicrobiae bacterium]|nr:8-amino-7-oxononanoate synthase [Verrucomicrobiae bacterium]
MKHFDSELSRRLAAIRKQNLFRELRRVDSPQSPRIQAGGKTVLNFSSNDYLGLANHPVLREAAIKAVENYGAGTGASRLICGSLKPFHELEEALADFKRTQAALSFSTGYATAIGTICALLDRDDVIILDKLVHACIVDAARLSGAKLRVFRHNDLNDLEDKLKWANSLTKAAIGKRKAQILVITESIFSMDGVAAPLKEMVGLKNKFGAWLMVDEAHATGILGHCGRGLADEFGVGDQIEVQMGTLGKALGAGGGYICGSRLLIEFLVNRARSFIFSTAPVPAAAAAALAGIQIVQSSEGDDRRSQLRSRIAEFHSHSTKQTRQTPGAIIPVVLGNEVEALNAAEQLAGRGIFVPAIRYPTVARGKARLRLTLTASHSSSDVGALVQALDEIVNHKS